MASGCGMNLLMDKMPERVFDVGIADVRPNYMAGSVIEYDITGSHARKNAKGMVIVKGRKFRSNNKCSRSSIVDKKE